MAALAQKKGCTSAQLCIAWCASLGELSIILAMSVCQFQPLVIYICLGDHVIPLPGSSKASRTLENFLAANVLLTNEEKIELDTEVEIFQQMVSGNRYPEMFQTHLMA